MILRALATTICAIVLTAPTYAQVSDFKPTPPGQVLLEACEEINSSTPGQGAMLQRSYCFRFLEAALMMDRLQTIGLPASPSQKIPAPAPAASVLGFCYPHSREWGISGFHVADIAKELIQYLRGVPERHLDRLSNGDDTQMRLLVTFLRKKYPCTSTSR